MKAESYWQQFVNSGKIEDYLSYSNINRQDLTANRNEETQKEGENPYAGSYYSDGNDLKSDAYR